MLNMLSTLRRIVQEVNAARDLSTALGIIVHRVREAMETQVCSVYLLNPDTDRYELMATDGLNKSAVGVVSLGSNEGLVGYVGVREEPVNLEDAAAHPRYRYFSETGEERYASFLGVPIIHHRQVMGVLVVRQKERRLFDEVEESFLVTMSAQLSGVIALADATGAIRGLGWSGEVIQDTRFDAVSGAPGVAIGRAVIMLPPADLKAVPDKQVKDVDAEIALYRRAAEAVRVDIRQLAAKLSSQLRPEELALFDVYLMMLDDSSLGNEIIQGIRDGQWAQSALRDVINAHVARFEVMDDTYLQERAADIKDLGRRLLACLQEADRKQLVFPKKTILVAEELTPSMLGEVPSDRLVGLVSVLGSGSSHVAILARAMGIPTVMGAVDLPWLRMNSMDLIIDGNAGEVYCNPSKELRRHYRELIREEQELSHGLEKLRSLPCVTLDGHRIPLWVNTGLFADIARSLDRGAEGVGLYRTEVPFMIQDRFPSEKEQQAIYREQLQAFHPQPVTMRTLDIGGDKELSYFPIKEDNPFLGWRGIRVTLDHPEIFLVQLRAMLKASEGLDNLRIMLPMISSVYEVEEALHLVHRAHSEVLEEGFRVTMPPVGVMIEVPAAVYQAAELAQLVDFLSVGTNDLTQYLLAVDRNNPRVADLYHSLHPAVLQALQVIAKACREAGKPMSVCGEMAGDPAAAVLLVALGCDVLSMSASSLPRVKWLLRQINFSDAQALLEQALRQDNAYLVQSMLHLSLRNMGLGKVLQQMR